MIAQCNVPTLAFSTDNLIIVLSFSFYETFLLHAYMYIHILKVGMLSPYLKSVGTATSYYFFYY